MGFFFPFCPSLSSFSVVLPLSSCCFSARQRQTQTRPRRTHFVRRPNAPINADTLFPPARGSANAPFCKQSLMFGGGSYKYLPTPGSVKAAQVFCMTKPHPFQMGYNLHLQGGGSLLTPPRAEQLTLTTTRKIRLAVAVYRDGLLNKNFSPFTVSAAAFGRAFHPYLLTVALFWGCCFFNLGAGAASVDSVPAPSAATGCAEALKNRPNSSVELVHPSFGGVSESVSFSLSVSAPPANRQQLHSEPTDSPPPSALGPPCAACGAQARAAQGLLGF